MFKKILKLGKKGAKHVPKGGAPAASSGIEWPPGMRIGVFGHANSGKTVYFTVLNEECKVSKDLGLSVTDNPTAGEFLSNYRAIWGLGTSDTAGTMVDLREDKKFPPATPGEKILQFNTILDRAKNIPVVAFDYNGKAVSIQEHHELAEKVKDFMQGCQGILFFFDPKMLGAELQCQAHVASFVNMCEALAPGGGRLPIPVALVVTKADVLPGFSGEGQTVLVSADQEHFLAEDYEIFLEKILSSNRIASNSAWAGSVRDVLVKLKDFLKLIVGRTLDFQVFFSSNTGVAPVKIGTDVGRSLYKPPDKMQPVGVREPFYWLLKSIIRNRRLKAFRKLSRWVVTLSILFAVVWSVPHLYNFHLKLNRISALEDRHWEGRITVAEIPKKARNDLRDQYNSFARSKFATWVFPDHAVQAGYLHDFYKNISEAADLSRLAKSIGDLTNIVRDSTRWPKPAATGDTVVSTEQVVSIETAIAHYAQSPEGSSLLSPSSRAIELWGLFKAALVQNQSADAWNAIVRQVDVYPTMTPKPSAEIKQLGQAMLDIVNSRELEQKREVVHQKTTGEFDSFSAQLSERTDAEYLLGTAVKKLRSYRGQLASDPDRQEDVARIDQYLKDAKAFDKDREYRFTLSNCPPGHHVHIKIEGAGKAGEWPRPQQIRINRPASIIWKKGDRIFIALHEKDHGGSDESWGESYKALAELTSDFAIVEMTEIITMAASGQQISFSFEEDPKKRLPKW
ncbi:MAG: hypothetical protein OEV49_02355 [candidate division Zixibacteria bacterium]|nr:hypothetical protein [candidate division Zixibacteria bacterium]MDH3937637.1 hypothetical protein [candidate division Zixibacteria bacterium]MDH4034145.1 hypothetical protein [candidate division Zixibacteria bacterium]